MQSIITALIGIFFLVSFTSCDQKPVTETEVAKAVEIETYYTCAMHPHIHEDKPGKCPICHMNLTKVEVEKNAALTGKKIEEDNSPKDKIWACASDHSITSALADVCPIDGTMMVDISVDEKKETLGIVAEVKLRKAQVDHFRPSLYTADSMILTDNIRLLGNVVRAEERESSVPARVAGRVEKVYISSVGSLIRQGDPVVDLYSPLLISGGEEYIIARKEFEKNKSKEYRHLFEQSLERLKLWGILESQVDQWYKQGTVPKNITIHAATSGVVSKLAAIKGRYFKEGENLVELSDLSSVWIEIDVYEYESSKVKMNQAIEISFSAIPETIYKGAIDFISPVLEPSTRTLKVRATIANPNGVLRPGMEGMVNLNMDLGMRKVVIPRPSIIDTGKRKVVWIKTGDQLFQAVEVTTGVEAEGYVEITGGIKLGDQIVMDGNFMIDAQAQLFGGYRE